MNEKKKLIVIGASGFSKTVIEVIESQNIYDILGFINLESKPSKVLGYAYLGDLSILKDLKESTFVVVAIGTNWLRKDVIVKVKAINPTIKFATIIHPTTVVSRSAEIGEGSVLCSNTYLGADTKLGKFNILYNGASIHHDSSTEAYCSIGPNSTIAGDSTIGERSAILMSSAVIHKTTIGKNVIVGSCSNVLDDIPNSKVAYGSPAKIVRDRADNERYY